MFSVKVTNSVPKKPKLYCPEFIPNLYDTNKFPVNETKNVLSKKNWITLELRNEVLKLFPTKEDIDVSDGNRRDRDAFARNASRLFPIDRIFYSHKQLDQVADLFCNAWAVKKTHPGKYIGCYFGKSIHSHCS